MNPNIPKYRPGSLPPGENPRIPNHQNPDQSTNVDRPFCWFEEIFSKKPLQIEKSTNFRCQSWFGIIHSKPWFFSLRLPYCVQWLHPYFPCRQVGPLFCDPAPPFCRAKRIAVIGSDAKAKSWQAIPVCQNNPLIQHGFKALGSHEVIKDRKQIANANCFNIQDDWEICAPLDNLHISP